MAISSTHTRNEPAAPASREPNAPPGVDARYRTRRAELEAYFDRTAVQAWARLTSNEPVGRIRATVRAGRDRMRATLLDWLPADLSGRRVLDAGCGTGALAIEAARRGAQVVAVDLSPTLVALARERAPAIDGGGSLDFRVGDFTDRGLGRFDHVVAMDSLIHYRGADIMAVLGAFADRCARSIVFTFAPRTPALTLMHAVGRMFPRGDRAPAIEPIAQRRLEHLIAHEPLLGRWVNARTQRIDRGFYISQAMEVVRK